VDDDGVDVAFLDPGEQGAQPWPVGGLGGLATVDELFNDLKPERGKRS
jgi:hypothetical protein